jgi:hypothetical protein
MKVKTMALPLLVVLVLGLAPLGFGQLAAPTQTSHRTLGYFDSATGSFTPLRPEQDPEAPAITPTTGTLVFNFTVSAKTAIPKNGLVTCSADASVFDSSGFTATENVTGIAKLVSGTTYSCALKIPYSWLLASAGTDTISLTVDAAIGDGLQITATNGTGTVVTPTSVRDSSQAIGTIKVPANGATTTETVAITL